MVASVIVAWLIDYANCKNRETRNRELLISALNNLLLAVINTSYGIICTCASYDECIDFNKDYSFDEIIEMLINADGNHKEWDILYHNLGSAMSSFDTTTLIVFEPTQKHMELHSLIHNIQQSHMQIDYIMNNYKTESNNGESIAYCSLKFELSVQIKEIFKIAGINIQKVEIPEALKEEIINKRNKCN